VATFGKVWPKAWAVSLIVNRTRVLACHVSLMQAVSLKCKRKEAMGDFTDKFCVEPVAIA
jgi:hypothetical protein